MSVRGRGGGRGRGRPKTQLWHFDTAYKPDESVYEANYRLKRAPPTITPLPPRTCPVKGCETRILRRTETHDGIPQIIYTVELRRLPFPDASGACNEEEVVTKDVDISRIDYYASRWEQQRFENAQFKAARDAEEALRMEKKRAQDQRYLRINFRKGVASAAGEYSADQTAVPSRGRRRPRARGRGTGRGGGRGRGGFAAASHTDPAMPEAVVAPDSQEEGDAEEPHLPPPPGFHREDPSLDHASNDEAPPSPSLMRSSFIANSALPTAAAAGVLPSGILRGHPEVPDISSDGEASEPSSVSGSARQLVAERRMRKRSLEIAETDEEEDNGNGIQHMSKRRRTESVASCQRPQPRVVIPRKPAPLQAPLILSSDSESSSDDGFEDDDVIEARIAPTNGHHKPQHPAQKQLRARPAVRDTPYETQEKEDHDAVQDSTASPSEHAVPPDPPDADEEAEETVEEWVVGRILAHNYHSGTRFFEVQWANYAGGTDWLPEADLEGAKDLVDEYVEKVRRRGEAAKR